MKTMMTVERARAAMFALGACLLLLPAAHAGLFDDDEARKAILDLRQKQDQAAARQAETSDQIKQLRSSLLDLNTQIEQLRGEVAKLRGQNEQLARDLSEVQRRQQDLKQGFDDRVRKLEPQKVTVDGKEFQVDQEEKRQYDEAFATLRKGDFAGGAAALAAFKARYSASGYNESVTFWLGNAQYGQKAYKEAIASFRSLVTMAPDNPHAPEALLSIANCQLELKDRVSARRTLNELLKNYPKSEAAQAGRERLAALK